ncbi:MAG: DUF763 domain-containing protein [Candidatus Odinarchaeota archaeon]|nr:DUF763 domain-containing protein [Candidatus Odinarchaeota archaeon]
MRRTGLSDLPLHEGKAPPWLIRRMIKLSNAILEILIDEYGTFELLKRLSDPFWFQAFSCVLGYDWHSSGTTTVTTGVLKTVINKSDKFKLFVAGGKGATSLKTPTELQMLKQRFGFNDDEISYFIKVSKLVAKVDNTLLQDGFNLYHHSLIIDEEGHWAVIQQGMDPYLHYARRYHWLSDRKIDFVNEPHTGIISNLKRDIVLDLTSRKSSETRKNILELIQDSPRELEYALLKIQDPHQSRLIEISNIDRRVIEAIKLNKIPYLKMPRKINWNAIKQAYRLSISQFEDFILIKGVGPALIRSLALVSMLIWGTPISWKDPVKYSFAHGGKDGVPYPVDLKRMERTASILEGAITQAKLGYKDKLFALKRLKNMLKIA